MGSTSRILAFAGSTRRGSFNKKLLHIAVRGARNAGAEVTEVDLRDFPMPLYDGDLEQAEGVPPNGLRLRELMLQHQGLLLACPEYNSSITGVLKNSIDWVSRPTGGQEGLAPYRNKVCALVSASPGGLGGLRGLVHVRSILGNIGVLVLPTQIAVPNAAEAFDENGELRDVTRAEAVKGLGAQLAEMVQRLNNDEQIQ